MRLIAHYRGTATIDQRNAGSQMAAVITILNSFVPITIRIGA